MYSAILLAAGSGERMGLQSNKVLISTGPRQRPLFEYALNVFIEDSKCEKIILVIREDDEPFFVKYLSEIQKETREKIHLVFGGCKRQDSVANALKYLEKFSPDTVFIHDAARPFIHGELLKRLYEATVEFGAAVVGIKARDTIKIVSNNQVVKTIDRSEILQTQTPQGFRFSLLKRAINQAYQDGFFGNEEGELVERIQHKVHIVEGTTKNFKVTTVTDLEMTNLLLGEDLEK